LTAQFVARRQFLPEAGDQPWAEAWRRRLDEMHVRALECYATACLELGGAELPGAERAARELLEVAPLRETGHLLLMRTLAARGNVAEALAAYEQLRVRLRETLGVNPGRAVQDTYAELLG
jgi:DNA-binding SARP family transcriptional activator